MKDEDREKLKSSINKTIDTVDAKLEKLKTRQKELTGEVRKQIDTRIADLEKKRKELVSQSSQIGKSAGEAARNLTEGFKNALKDLEAGASAAWKEFQKKE